MSEVLRSSRFVGEAHSNFEDELLPVVLSGQGIENGR